MVVALCTVCFMQEMIESVREGVVEMLHTREGARVAMICLWYGTTKVSYCLYVIGESGLLPVLPIMSFARTAASISCLTCYVLCL